MRTDQGFRGSPEQRKRTRDLQVLNHIYETQERRASEQEIMRALSFHGLSLATVEATLKQWEVIGVIRREGSDVVLTEYGALFVAQGRQAGLVRGTLPT